MFKVKNQSEVDQVFHVKADGGKTVVTETLKPGEEKSLDLSHRDSPHNVGREVARVIVISDDTSAPQQAPARDRGTVRNVITEG